MCAFVKRVLSVSVIALCRIQNPYCPGNTSSGVGNGALGFVWSRQWRRSALSPLLYQLMVNNPHL